ncbi:MAG: DNA repair protein RecO [Candidatus Komeilibacteria bacterium CG11_big_fil_rev_8_21_14_0_20_36_20]|uniref:DNA repair protein RecO n=1 Tax=Candidatus Komeilibacteria bacterium CG11_big_fil_rev_8_21_14_0_20_36_20 TaxID=1974477 RepID=A0A2H0NE17_9BACT|nr:MAG: DNA repair protein RecO [Candidatus Komeilibacteria bacterium CG11_big_fil_rev_8_21_14_0_20_36_20]PIR81260.1 MAG: DNA repair protein RecO [Candidatus Komeilibacteria bacterium CG10_big_fil_rev_8_21_14_0_10_36_65]PJC55224.1 MAG: DNA repair protein RecO [Candidatus Komeilibacteria bacterium CG_4_9_14_0_2_um_filter_36_13]
MSFKTEAFVLHSRPWKNADRLYSLFTPQEGLIEVIVKSAAKSGNKLAGHLLPFSRVKVMIGRGRLDHLAGASVVIDYANLRSDLRLLSLSSSVIELFLASDGGAEKIKEFELLGEILFFLNNQEISTEHKLILVRIFLWKYLSLAGWRPQLDSCVICQKDLSAGLSAGEAGKYMPGRGIICREHQNVSSVSISGELIKFLQFIIRADWGQLDSLSISQNLNKEWLKISQIYYQTVYDKPSQSLKLFIYG